MKIRDMRAFRTWFNNLKPSRKNNPFIDENFVGVYNEITGKTGFFGVYHGEKENIANFLMDGLKNAQDGQAIYEFIQNAADCESTYFAIFYNDDYFLAINNGSPFSQKDILSILNANQSSKTNELGEAVDCEKIGRFGIGFKLVHRLVGENDGMKELIEQYKGPVIFSWSKPQQLVDLSKLQNSEQLDFEKDEPYLFKILITNFPCLPNETVRDINYNEKVLFDNEEFKEFLSYFQTTCQKLDFNLLDKGSLFFLKLGKNKRKHLDEQKESLLKGVKCGLNNLKTLKTVLIADEQIHKLPLQLIDFKFNNGEVISPEDTFCDVRISFGYLSNYKKGIDELRGAPNFYKYFPMSRETHGLNFTLHSTAFRIKTDRTQFEEDSDSTNTSIFNVFWKKFEPKLQEIKKQNPDEFRNIYANLLVSKPLIDENGKEKWLYQSFYMPLLDFLRKNIPTKNNQFSKEPENVKINNLKLNLNLSDFGLDHIQWFEWENDNDSDLTLQATNSEKLGLENWDIRDIIEKADLVCINKWISSCANETYKAFLNELENCGLRQKTKEKICQIKLFPFTDGTFKSFNEIFYNPKIYKFSKEIEKLGFGMPKFDISNFKNICSATNIKSDREIFLVLAEKCKTNALTADEKKRLFLSLIYFDNVGKTSLRELYLFCDSNSQIKPLKELIGFIKTPTWLNSYKIKQEELFPELNAYLISENEIYQEIILPNWGTIIPEVWNILEFYQKIKEFYSLKKDMPLLGKKPFVFVNENNGFFQASDVFYNSKFTQISNYQHFQNAVGCLTPNKNILNFLQDAPFKIDDEDFSVLNFETDTELQKDEVEALLDFCKLTRDNFFEHCYVEKVDNAFFIGTKTNSIQQVYVPQRVREFAESNLSSEFKILPNEFSEERENNPFIVKDAEFYLLLLDNVDIDECADELIRLNILAYDEPKRKFLLQLSEIRFVAGEQYDKESFEYKMLNLVCDSKILRETDYPKFREKIIIETSEKDLTLAEIPPFADRIKIEGYELSLAKILPDNYQNSNYLSDLVTHFINLGLGKERLNAIFGISQEPDLDIILENLKKESKGKLINAEQIAFVVLYHQFVACNANYNDGGFFTFLNINNTWTYLYTQYVQFFLFLEATNVFSKDYRFLSKILNINSKNPTFPNGYEAIIYEPYFSESTFICPYLSADMSDEQKQSLIEFLFNQWDKKDKKTIIRSIDWTTISETETEKLLGFNPIYSVFPSEFALESEELPEYLQVWIANDSNKISFIADLGVFTEKSTLVSLRKFFANQGDFNQTKIAQDTRFTDEKMLFNTFVWLKSREIELNRMEEFEVFEEMVRVINLNRHDELEINRYYDVEQIEANAKELEAQYYLIWKEKLNAKFHIFLLEGNLPITVSLSEIDKYVFYRYRRGDVCCFQENNIYINSNVDMKTALSKLVARTENEFSANDLLLLYQLDTPNPEPKVEELNGKIKNLEERIRQLESYENLAPYAPTVATDQNILAFFEKIRQKSEKYVFEVLKKQFSAEKVRWHNFDNSCSQYFESRENHDFQVLDGNGNVLHYIDCKGTGKDKRTFYLTDNEWDFFLDCVRSGTNYQIYRVFYVESTPKHILIDNLWEWLMAGDVVPYLLQREEVSGGRVFLTLKSVT